MWLKTWFAATATATVAMTGALSADDFFYNNSDECCYQYGYTVPAHVEDECGCSDFCINAEWLYWKPSGEELEYGITKFTNTDISTIPPSTYTRSHTDNVDFKWDSGFRLGIGYNFPCDGWDLVLNWTYFRGKAHDKTFSTAPVLSGTTTVSSGTLFVPTWTGVDFPGPISFASAHWKVNLNLVDLELGRAFFASPCLTLRPHVGFRYASIDQKYDLSYLATGDLVPTIRFTDRINMKNDFAGLGLRMGLDTNWDLGCGFGIYFGGAAALIYGDLDVRQSEFFNDLTTAVGDQLITQRDHKRSLKANTEFNIGVQWAKPINCNRQSLLFRIGYEHQIFFAQNKFRNFVNRFTDLTDYNTSRHDIWRSNGGDLGFHGFTFLAQICF
jgi:hypothetical protein